jgi:hypothetical protein
MSIKKILYSAFIVGFTIAVISGCKKSVFDINKNPNQATDSTVSYDVILAAAQHSSGALVGTTWGFLQNWMGYWARSGTYAPNVIEETYQITTTFGNGVWNGAYDNAFDYQIMQVKAKQNGATFYEGIARIMKSLDFQILVDVYGSVPYFDALKGNANPTPKYDKGDVIYKDLFRQIDTGITLIKNATVTTSINKGIRDNDIMFGAAGGYSTSSLDAQKLMWRKFGNTLKLRLLVHLMNGGVNTAAGTASGFDIAGEFTKIAADGSGYLGVGENVQVNPGYKVDKPNPFYTTYKNTVTGTQTANNVYYRANEWGINYYAADADPREARVYEPGGNGFVGVAYGLPPVTENSSDKLAGIGPGVYKTNSSAQAIFTAAESFFLQAEARQRGIITTSTAAALLNTAVEESMKYLGVANVASALADYYAWNAGYPDVDITAGALTSGYPSGGIFTIISSKWFALNAVNTLEVWTDYRRVNMKNPAGTDVGHFIYGQGAGYDPGPPISVSPQNTSQRIPIRLLYPQTEYNYNAANVGTEGTINQFTSRIFWDAN